MLACLNSLLILQQLECDIADCGNVKILISRFGSMVAFFRYSPIDILSVRLPPSVLEFNGHVQPDWIRIEATEVF